MENEIDKLDCPNICQRVWYYIVALLYTTRFASQCSLLLRFITKDYRNAEGRSIMIEKKIFVQFTDLGNSERG
jgi:hypothetical protein